MTDLAFISLAAAGELLRDRQLSPVEYTQALLDRIVQLDERYHAFIRPTPERAMAAARRAEAEIMAGGWRGPLHGVPFGLKDIIDVAGLPTTAHSRVLINNVATADAPRCGTSRRCRRRHDGQARDTRVRHRRAVVRSPLATGGEPLGQQPFPRRLIERLGRRARRRHAAGCAWHGHGGLGAQPGLHVRHHRA